MYHLYNDPKWSPSHVSRDDPPSICMLFVRIEFLKEPLLMSLYVQCTQAGYFPEAPDQHREPRINCRKMSRNVRSNGVKKKLVSTNAVFFGTNKMSTRIFLLEPKWSVIECFLGSNKISSSLLQAGGGTCWKENVSRDIQTCIAYLRVHPCWKRSIDTWCSQKESPNVAPWILLRWWSKTNEKWEMGLPKDWKAKKCQNLHKYTHSINIYIYISGVCESLHHPKRGKLLDFTCVSFDAKRLGRGKSASLESTSQCWGRTSASCLQTDVNCHYESEG